MDLRPQFEATRQASRELAAVPPAAIDALLRDLADATVAATNFLLAENARDLARMPQADPRHDRLRLTPERLASIAADLRTVAGLPSPVGEILSQKELPNALRLSKVRVPLGIIGIIYEARPNVTFDSLALCLKTGNACLLNIQNFTDEEAYRIQSFFHDQLNIPATLQRNKGRFRLYIPTNSVMVWKNVFCGNLRDEFAYKIKRNFVDTVET